ncbi:histone-lysine N-methyltransferase SETMAR [Trichonephila clavipes]|nr:histone-lysine N-methyltransferase SETMAR [Trichonephila clavipes]
MKSVASSPRVPEQYDVNIHSLIQQLQRPRGLFFGHLLGTAIAKWSRSLSSHGTFQFFFNKGKYAAEIVNGVVDTVAANYVQFWFRQFRSGIFDVKDEPSIVENVDKITEITEVDRHVSSRGIVQELKIDHKTVLNHLRKCGEAAQTVVKLGLTARKVLLCIGWDWKGISYYKLLPYGQTLNSDPYRQQLDRLKRAICQNWPKDEVCVPSGQLQATHVCSDSLETLGAWLRSFNASTIQSDPSTKRLPPFSCIAKLHE